LPYLNALNINGNQFCVNKEVLCPQQFYNTSTTNHRWLVVIGSNLNLSLKLLFCLTDNNL